MQSKQCTKCSQIKSLSEFSKNKSRKDGLGGWCKECANVNAKKHYQANAEKKKKYQKKYHHDNLDKIKAYRSTEEYKVFKRENDKKDYKKHRTKRLQHNVEYMKVPAHKKHLREYRADYYEKNKERLAKESSERYFNNKEERSHKAKIFRENNREKLSLASKKYRETDRAKELKRLAHKRERSTIEGRLRHALSTRLWHALKGKYKNSSTIEYLGCTIGELKSYLESQFQKGMTWANYGTWHVDHLKACANFDLTKESQIKKCFHYSNLQPLFAFDNLSKGARAA